MSKKSKSGKGKMILAVIAVLVIVGIAAFYFMNFYREPVSVTNAVFACENNPSVSSRAYVVLMGLGDHNVQGMTANLQEITASDSKLAGTLIYDYDETTSLAEIKEDFLGEFDSFIAETQPEEIVVIGLSAGGTVASASASLLSFEGLQSFIQ